MKKYSVIFFLVCIFLILIFNKFNSNSINILYIGDSNIFNRKLVFEKYKKINKYTYDNITYRELESEIKSNSNKIIKDRVIYLNQLISKSDVIILSANNFKYYLKCKKSESILSEYDKVILNEINSLVDVINKISNAKIYVIGNYCGNKKYIQDMSSNKIIYINYENLNNIEDIISKTINY